MIGNGSENSTAIFTGRIIRQVYFLTNTMPRQKARYKEFLY